MKSIFYTGLLLLLWVVNLFNGTGLDSAYHVTDWARRIVILWFILDVIFSSANRKILLIGRNKLYIYGGMIILFLASPCIHGYGATGIKYVWVFCLVYLLSKLKINDRTMLWTGLIYGVLGLVILFIFDYGTALKGWNENSIAMLGMHSFLVMLVPFFREHRLRNRVFLLLAAGVFYVLVFPTDSRSGILFAFIGTMFAIGLLPKSIVSKNRFRTLICLFLPLIIAIIVVILSKSSVMDRLNIWSYQQFNKPIFNGRDLYWAQGFNLIWKKPLIGTGDFRTNYWHNSAVTCLVTTGIFGFILWIMSFLITLDQARQYLSDYIVIGCFVSFIVLYIQQSVELGFICASPSLIGYILLGLMLGRVRFLKEQKDYGKYQNQHNCACI